MQLWKQMHPAAYSMLSETKCLHQTWDIPWLQRLHISKHTEQNCTQRNELRNQSLGKNKSDTFLAEKLGAIPCYYCFSKLCFVSHRLVYIWNNWMSCKAKSIDPNSKWNTAPIHQLASVMESNRCPDTKHADNNQYCCSNPSSCRSQLRFQLGHVVKL